MNILWLREQFPWMGSYSGYDLLCENISNSASDPTAGIFSLNKSLPFILQLALNPVMNKIKMSATYGYCSFFTELLTGLQAYKSNCDLVHVLYVEKNLSLLPRLLPRQKLIGTAHQPPDLWINGRHNPRLTNGLDALIVLSKKSKNFFEEYLPGKVFYIPHGIDTDFFTPEENKKPKSPRCVFSGTWLRDLDGLEKIIAQLSIKNPGIQFDLVVPDIHRNNETFHRIARFDMVHWHANLSDIQLRDLYRRASMLLLPMRDCTANNALLEGMACGLPVISNNVGGMPDYTNNEFASLFEPGDVDSMTDAVLELADNPKECIQKGKLARTFTVNNLNWKIVADQTYSLYQSILSQ